MKICDNGIIREMTSEEIAVCEAAQAEIIGQVETPLSIEEQVAEISTNVETMTEVLSILIGDDKNA